MEVRVLLEWTRKEPFVPFVVILQSGTQVPVNHPEEIFFLPNTSRVEDIIVYAPERRYIFGPTAVTAVETKRGNGNGG